MTNSKFKSKLKQFVKPNRIRMIFFLIGAIPISILFFDGIIQNIISSTELSDKINLLLGETGFFALIFIRFPFILIGIPMMILAVFFCGDFDECPDFLNLIVLIISYVIALVVAWCLSLVLEAIFNFIIKNFKQFFRK